MKRFLAAIFLALTGFLTPAEATLISYGKTWVNAEVLTHSDLNGNFTNVTSAVNGSLDESNLAATIALADSDYLNLSSINMSSASEGLRLGGTTSCSSATADGQLCWDTDDDTLVGGTGAATVTFLKASSPVDLALTGAGPDLTWAVTSSDTYHFGADSSGLLLSNSTDGAHLFQVNQASTWQQYGNTSTTLSHVFRSSTTGSGTFQVPNGAIGPVELDAQDAPGDEEFLTYENSTGRFEWQTGALKSKTSITTRVADENSGTQAITGLGFQPTACQAMLFQNGTAGDGAQVYSLGYVDSGLTHAVVSWAFDNAAGDDYAQRTSWIASTEVGLTNTQTVTIQSFDTNGYTLSWTEGGTGPAVIWSAVCYQ